MDRSMEGKLDLDQALLFEDALISHAQVLTAEYKRQEAEGYIAGSLLTKIDSCKAGLAKTRKLVADLRRLMRSS